MNNTKKSLKVSNGITLIALVITIIVLLILAGISISMLSGDNSILQKATDAKTNTDNAQIKERVQLAYLAALTGGNGSLTEDSFKQELIKEFGTSKITDDTIVTSEDGKTWNVTIDGAVAEVEAVTNTLAQKKLGDAYEENWIGKTIKYSAGPSGNEVSDWIIIGQDKTNKDVLITTANPVEIFEVNLTLEGWCDYIKNLNTACSVYAGKIGKNNVAVKQARSITLDDINNAVGFTLPETFDEFTFGATQDFEHNQVKYFYPDETNKTWINPNTSGTTWPHANDVYYYYNDNGTYKYGSAKNGSSLVALSSTNLSKPNNMAYVLANNSAYWVASRSVSVGSDTAGFFVANVGNGLVGCHYSYVVCNSNASGGNDRGGSGSVALRPCIVLSSEIPYDDVKDDIGATYKYE